MLASFPTAPKIFTPTLSFVALDESFIEHVNAKFDGTGIRGTVSDVKDLRWRVRNTAFVSPSNSLLFMDGGIDRAYSRDMWPNGVYSSSWFSVKMDARHVVQEFIYRLLPPHVVARPAARQYVVDLVIVVIGVDAIDPVSLFYAAVCARGRQDLTKFVSRKRELGVPFTCTGVVVPSGLRQSRSRAPVRVNARDSMDLVVVNRRRMLDVFRQRPRAFREVAFRATRDAIIVAVAFSVVDTIAASRRVSSAIETVGSHDHFELFVRKRERQSALFCSPFVALDLISRFRVVLFTLGFFFFLMRIVMPPSPGFCGLFMVISVLLFTTTYFIPASIVALLPLGFFFLLVTISELLSSDVYFLPVLLSVALVVGFCRGFPPRYLFLAQLRYRTSRHNYTRMYVRTCVVVFVKQLD